MFDAVCCTISERETERKRREKQKGKRKRKVFYRRRGFAFRRHDDFRNTAGTLPEDIGKNSAYLFCDFLGCLRFRYVRCRKSVGNRVLPLKNTRHSHEFTA